MRVVSNNKLEELSFDNVYSQLPEEFWQAVAPQPLMNMHLISVSQPAAALIDLDYHAAQKPGFIDFFTGAKSWPGSRPIAMCYAGHQFGVYVPRLGDGRAILLGQVRNSANELWDIQVKGSGPTLYSRQSDGRAVLRSSIREYLCSEAMAGLGIPTTRALCLIGSRQVVYRERPEPGAMLVRMAESHIRFGSFEYFFYSNQLEHLRQLADYLLQYHFPQCMHAEQAYLALLDAVISSTARLIAQWQGVGFAHGVMNTDNMSMLGLTLDYGPFAFLDTYQAGYIGNHSDHQGRYAFDQQPQIGLFNLSCLAQALLPLLAAGKEQAELLAKESLSTYQSQYQAALLTVSRAKLGLHEQGKEDLNDASLWRDVLALMEGQVDYTRFFRALCQFNSVQMDLNNNLRDQFVDRDGFDAWAIRYCDRLQREDSIDVERQLHMQRVNPKYILRNYLAEQAIRKAEDEGDYSEIERLLLLLHQPYDEQTDLEIYAAAPPEWAQSISISCSS